MKKLYDLNAFKASLEKITSLRCSNDLTFGLRLYNSKSALDHRYIQVNNDKAIMFLVIDLDHKNPMIWDKVGLPAPNLCATDRRKNTSHLIYALEYPIHKEYAQNYKALALFAKIQQVYTKLLQGDPLYTNAIAKNPLNLHWHTTNPNPFRPYTLYELADYVDLPQKIRKREAVGEGRNCFLFDSVRQWSYKEVLFYKSNQATEDDFRNAILAQLDKINSFPQAQPVGYNELKNIAKSISKWTWNRFSTEKFSEIQSKRGKRNLPYIQAQKTIKKQEQKQKQLIEFINEFS